MKEIDNLIGIVDKYRTEFYQKAIEVHNDERLRGMAGQNNYGFRIAGQYTSEPHLSYTEKGFKVRIPVISAEQSGYSDYTEYDSEYYAYKVKENKLIANGKELLHHFPNLTLEELINKIAQGIKELPIYKKACGGQK